MSLGGKLFRRGVFSLFVLFLCVSQVGAVDFAGDSSGIFQNALNGVVSGVGTNNFAWGTGDPSRLVFTGTSFTGDFETTEFSFGSLSYYNGTINSGTGADGVELQTTLTFTLPLGITQSFDFSFNLINTTNTSDPYESADYVKLGNAWDPTKTFSYGGIDYTLNFTRFGVVGSGGFITTVDEFHVLEGYSVSAEMFGKITAHPTGIPEPASMFLLGSGLFGMVALRRKFKE